MGRKCMTDKICERFPHFRSQIDEMLMSLTGDGELNIHRTLAKELLKELVDRSEKCRCSHKLSEEDRI